MDHSNGYEEIVAEFVKRRNSRIGSAEVRAWSQTLPRGASILDLGCGHGLPLSQTLIEGGFTLYAIDASPKMIAAFRERFPNAHTECSAVEESTFFGRAFDGVIAWGLMFLLSPTAQEALIRKVARVLKPGGKFLFTSPKDAVTWTDVMTQRESVSLGLDAYHRILRSEGCVITGDAIDEGENYYYLATSAASG